MYSDFSEASSVCQTYHLFKYESGINGTSSKQFHHAATLSPSCLVEGNSNIFWHTFTGFNGKQLKVGYLDVGRTDYMNLNC